MASGHAGSGLTDAGAAGQKGDGVCGPPSKIRLLDSLLCPEEYTKFRDAAAILGVSKTALAIRMKQLGLLEHSDLFSPGKIMDIFWEEGEG